ncbi:LysR substrate-binding domain-containing protein [Pseudoxanthomonas sp. J35]|uniref:LysR substrate-binding domain-containing protein n=1 Tax=Pseudoxanthomonas sp. J35 TaxID=935852 RepID=UPI0004B25D01|nr:LysR substrate-binding domain-containing protein [Pseudoxanthomonas sp. J35]
MGALRDRIRTRPVTVSATIGFTGLWLLPRLSRFQARHPGVDVRVSAHNRVVDLRNDGVDLAIRYTSAGRAPPGARLLFHETVVPVASPELEPGALDGPASLAGLTLLEFEKPGYPWIQWLPWLASVGWGEARPRAILHFNQYDLVIQAALAGQGIALGRREPIRPLLEEGRLVVLDDLPAPEASGHGYWLLQAEAELRPEVEAVATWIADEARQESAAPLHRLMAE